MGLRSRLKNRLSGLFSRPPAKGSAVVFDRATAEIWQDLREQYAHGWQSLAAAVVASWEVAAAELNAALRHTNPRAPEFVTRFSDGLVPTLTPFQAAERGAERSWNDGTRQAIASGQLTDALPPLIDATRRIGSEVETAWPATVAFLEPVLVAVNLSSERRQQLIGVGADLRDRLDKRAYAFAEALKPLATAPDVEGVFLDALGDWRQGAAQDLEVGLDRVRALLVGAE